MGKFEIRESKTRLPHPSVKEQKTLYPNVCTVAGFQVIIDDIVLPRASFPEPSAMKETQSDRSTWNLIEMCLGVWTLTDMGNFSTLIRFVVDGVLNIAWHTRETDSVLFGRCSTVGSSSRHR